MNTYYQRRRALLRLAIIAFIGALFFGWLFYRSVSASTVMLIRLYHDQDTSGTVTAGDLPAAGVTIEVTEATCPGVVCAATSAWLDIARQPSSGQASPAAWTVTTDSQGYATIKLHDGEYAVEAPCMAATVAASDVSGQSVTEWATCAQGIWLPVVSK